VFERTVRTVPFKFSLHPVVALLNIQNFETQNGVAAAGSYSCNVALVAKIRY